MKILGILILCSIGPIGLIGTDVNLLTVNRAFFSSAKVNGVATQLSGKVGQLIYRQTKYGTVVYEAPAKASVPQRTEAQMQIRTQWRQPTHERMQSQACLSTAEARRRKTEG